MAKEQQYTDEAEARWNYAFWLQNELLCFGYNETASIVKKWITDNGFPYYEDDDDAWNNDTAYDDTADITKAFISLLIDIVKEMHKQQLLTKKFGRELPVIIHELEYYDEIANQNIEANGAELVEEFSKWCINS